MTVRPEGARFEDRAFAQAFGGGELSSRGSWAPVIEVSEGDNELRVCAELPGLEGARRRTERRYGRFFRAIPLPEGTNTEQARADFTNGELHVAVPVHRAETQRRRIQIETGSGVAERPGKAA